MSKSRSDPTLRVTVDGVEPPGISGPAPVAAEALRAHLDAGRLVLRAAALDGRPVLMESWGRAALAGGTLEVLTEPAAAVYRRMAGESALALERLRAGVGGVVASLRQGRPAEGLTALQGLLDGLGGVLAGVGAVRAAQAAWSQADPAWEELERGMGDASGILQPIHGAASRRDWVDLSDLLGYELEPALASWQARFERLAS